MERAIPHLPGDDLEVAKDFYVNKLGFQIAYEASEDGREGMLGLRRGTIHFAVDCPMDGHGRNACVVLEVASADAYYDEWRQRVAVQRPPHNEEWGARTFSLHDPFGNTIFIMEPTQ